MPYIKLSEFCAKKIYNSSWPIFRVSKTDYFNLTQKCVIKVDQYVKRRGKKGLIESNITNPEQITKFIEKNSKFYSFIVEPQLNVKEERYFAIKLVDGKKQYIYSNSGGINCDPLKDGIVLNNIYGFQKPLLDVILKLDNMFDEIQATFLECNPIVLTQEGKYVPVDFAVEIDECAVNFLKDYYRKLIEDMPIKESGVEREIKELDNSSGASLKFKILNPEGRILTLIAGGGASVLYTDAIVNRGFKNELFNYGEYSGNPTEDEVMKYCSLIFEKWFSNNAKDRILFIGGGISNFTDVAKTFKGIIKAMKNFDFSGVKVWVRRGGVNEKIGLNLLKNELEKMNVDAIVKGTETPITKIVVDALPQVNYVKEEEIEVKFSANYEPKNIKLWNNKIIFVGNQTQIIQRIIDYEYYIGKDESSLLCIYEPTSRKDKIQEFYWGNKRFNVPITSEPKNLGNFTITVYNYASVRSCESITKKLCEIDNVKTFYIIAEGFPERKAIELSSYVGARGKTLLGPSSVGAIKSGIDGFRIGSVGGLMDNIKRCNLHKKGNVAIITKSGGLLNEMINFVTQIGLMIGEAVSIGGDRYPGVRFGDLLNYYSKVDNIKLVIMIGETGGTGELEGNCTKPVIAWCSGTSEKCFGDNIEFGHAGASANSKFEEAAAKNKLMRKKGYYVPDTFEELGKMISEFSLPIDIDLTNKMREVPIDISEAISNGIIRINPNFKTSLTDERNDLKYRGENVEDILAKKSSLGYTIGSLWLNIKLDDWSSNFIEKILVLMADHGPAVSGAQNTIITARAGKNLIESLTAGLLTIGPKFGGAISAAANDFYDAYLADESPANFVERMKNEGKLIMGIGHKIKSKFNPDKRVTLLKNIIKSFPTSNVFQYALRVEEETLKKKATLILNVDGAIGAALVDLILNYRTIEETKIIIKTDLFNGFFVLARTIGLIGHYQEQKTQDNGLYRANSWEIEYSV